MWLLTAEANFVAQLLKTLHNPNVFLMVWAPRNHESQHSAGKRSPSPKIVLLCTEWHILMKMWFLTLGHTFLIASTQIRLLGCHKPWETLRLCSVLKTAPWSRLSGSKVTISLQKYILSWKVIFCAILWFTTRNCMFCKIFARWRNPSIHPSIHPSMHPCIHASIHPCMHASMDGWMDGWIDGWSPTNLFPQWTDDTP